MIFNRLLKHIMPHITLLQKQNTMNSANAYHFCMAYPHNYRISSTKWVFPERRYTTIKKLYDSFIKFPFTLMNSHLSNETFSVEQGPTTVSKVSAIIKAISNQRDATKKPTTDDTWQGLNFPDIKSRLSVLCLGQCVL